MTSRIGGSIIFETSLGNFTVDLFTDDAPKACENLLKLCKVKFFNRCIFHNVQRNFIIQTGISEKDGISSIWGLIKGKAHCYFTDELQNQRRKLHRVRHDRAGLVCMANVSGRPNTNASQFYITTGERHLDYLDDQHTIFGEVSEGLDVVMLINETITDSSGTPMKPVRIKHTVVIEDPFPDISGLETLFRRSPSPSEWVVDGTVSSSDEEEMDEELLEEKLAARKKESQEKLLQLLGDIGEDMAPPDNVLFVCKLNSVTQDEDLELIFSRFGRISSCEIIRDRKTKDSLCYAFIEYETREACEAAYKKMENVLIDDRRIHVDFSQSVAKLWTKFKKDKTGGQFDPQGFQQQSSQAIKSNLKIRDVERAPDRSGFVLDDAAQLQKAYHMIGAASKEDKKKKSNKDEKTGMLNTYGDEEWSDDDNNDSARSKASFMQRNKSSVIRRPTTSSTSTFRDSSYIAGSVIPRQPTPSSYSRKNDDRRRDDDESEPKRMRQSTTTSSSSSGHHRHH